MAIQVTRRQFTAAEYDRMIETGILQEDERVELIDGDILEMSPIGSRHAACVNRLNALLIQHAGQQAIVSVQNPIRLGTYSEPEPDIAVLKPDSEYYAYAHPTAADILLLIEVAETSLEYDREVKIPRYAAVGIPEVWLLDLRHQVVVVYTQPHNNTYQHQHTVQGGELVRSSILGGVAFHADDILWQ